MAPDRGRRLLAEAIGRALLVVFGAGAVVAALRLGNGKLDYAGLGIIAFSFALVIAMVIYAFGSTSGAHINPGGHALPRGRARLTNLRKQGGGHGG